MLDVIRRLLTRAGELIAHPAGFAILLIYVVIWLIFDRQSFDWHAVATIATWAMTLFIQRAEHRDTLALQAKIDELLRASAFARNDMTQIDRAEPEEIEAKRREEDANGALKRGKR